MRRNFPSYCSILLESCHWHVLGRHFMGCTFLNAHLGDVVFRPYAPLRATYYEHCKCLKSIQAIEADVSAVPLDIFAQPRNHLHKPMVDSPWQSHIDTTHIHNIICTDKGPSLTCAPKKKNNRGLNQPTNRLLYTTASCCGCLISTKTQSLL